MTGNINFSTPSENLSYDSDCLDLDISTLIFNTWEIVFVVATNIITSITVILNSFALFTILKTEQLRNYKVSFVISQVICDTIYALIMTLVNLVEPNVGTYVIFNFVGMFYINVTVSCTICSSVEKYILLLNPYLHGRLVTKKRVFVAVVIVWVLSVCLSNPFTECSFLTTLLSSYSRGYHRYAYPTVHSLGLAVLTIIYIHIFIIARRHLNEIASLKHFITETCKYKENKKQMNKSKIKFVTFFMAVFFTYAFLLTPITAAKCYVVIKKFFKSENYYTLLFIVQFLQSLSFVSNLFIYTWKYPGFAKASSTEYNKICKWISGCLVCKCYGQKGERNAIVVLEMQRLNK